MTAITKAPDTTSRATALHIDQSLISLACLPSRQSDDAGRDNAAFHVALEGVTKWALSEAVRAILKGSLKHAFFPNPVELRMQCDAFMRQAAEHETRRRRSEAFAEECRRLDSLYAERTPEQRAHVQRVYEGFLQRMGKVEHDSSAFRTAMEAKYGANALSQIPDRPNTVRLGE